MSTYVNEQVAQASHVISNTVSVCYGVIVTYGVTVCSENVSFYSRAVVKVFLVQLQSYTYCTSVHSAADAPLASQI